MLAQQLEVSGPEGQVALKRLRFVVTKPESARANLTFFAHELSQEDLVGKLSKEIFDGTGTRRIITTDGEAKLLRRQLGGPL